MPAEKNFKNTTLSEEVAAWLRKDLLLSSAYPPGSYIREEEVAKTLNVSRAPVREGLKILEGLGLLKSVPQKGSLVVDFSPEEVEELYDIRFALEDMVFREIVRKGSFTLEDRDSLKKILSKMLLLGKTQETREEFLLEFSRIDMDFHLSLAEKAGRQWTLRLLKMVYSQIQQAVLRDLATEEDMNVLVEDHLKILNALLEGNLDEIRQGRYFSYFERRVDPIKKKERAGKKEQPSKSDQIQQVSGKGKK